MTNLLVFKERFKSLYQKYEVYIQPLLKFIYALIVLCLINDIIGYNDTLKKVLILLAISTICAFIPSSVFVLIVGLFSLMHIYTISKELAFIVFVMFSIIYALFVRFAPKLGYLMVAIPILYILKIPFIVPITVGLIYTPVAIVQVSCGVLIYYIFLLIKNNFTTIVTTNAEEILQAYIYLVNAFLSNKLMILTIIVFGLVVIVTYLIGRMSIDHAWDIAIVSGAVSNILVFLIGSMFLDTSMNLISMILGTLASAIIVYIVQFFRITVDYSRVERVQFEDDEYYYYVKAVPKMNVTTPEVNVKRINARRGNIQHSLNSKRNSENNLEDDEY